MESDNRHRMMFFSFIALMLGTFACIAWYIISVNPYRTYQIITEEAVTGLVEDAPVEFHGVLVGSVKYIELVNPHRVKILLHINKTAPITTATSATIISRGLSSKGFTGYVYISLEDTNMNSAVLTALPGSDYPTIPTKPSNLMTLDTAMSKLGNNAQKITDMLESILDQQTIATLKELIDNLQLVSKTLAMNNKKLHSLIGNTEKASYQLKPLLDSSQVTINTLETQILPKAYNSLTQLDSLTDSLSIMVDKLKQDPSMMIRGVAPQTPGPGE